MARTGLRMMPTFPPLPLKFRKAGFPSLRLQGQYVRRAFLSTACPPRRTVCIRPSCISLPVSSSPRSESRDAVRWCTTVQAVETALPQGSSLRSGLCCPGPSPLNRPHPSHSQAQRDFAAERLIRAALAVRQTCTPRRPTSGSVLSLACCLDMSSSGTPGSSSVTSIQSVHRRHWPSTSLEGLGASHAPHPPLSWGSLISGLHYGSLSLRPADLLALLSERAKLSPSPRGLLLPGFRRIGHPHRRRV